MSLAMLISAALLVQSLRSLSSIDPGFRADDLLLISVDPGSAGYDGPRVRRSGATRSIGCARSRASERVAGQDRAAAPEPSAPAGSRTRRPARSIEIDTNAVGPATSARSAFRSLRGREFDDRDGGTSRPVVIVNERLAPHVLAGTGPGRQTASTGATGQPGAGDRRRRDDVKYRDLRETAGPMLYVPILQATTSDAMTLHVRAAGEPGALAADIRRELQALDPNLPLFAITTLEDQLNASWRRPRQAAS